MRFNIGNLAGRATVLFVAFGVIATASFAQQAALSPEKTAAIQKAASDFMVANRVPGLAAAVVLDGKPVWAAGFGLADLENAVPATSETLFRLGSISKPITATAVMQLVEHNKLDLDAPVQKYCSAFPQKDWPITTRQLLGHLGGVRHYNSDGKGDILEDSAKHFPTTEASLAIFENDPLVAKPGTKFNYSTYGYTLVGCVLEGAAGQKYADFVRENIFHRAGMSETQVDNYFAVIPHRSRWYHKNVSGIVENAGVLDSSYKIPGGGLISSADDMALFAVACLADNLVTRKTRYQMWTPQTTSDGTPTTYGLGWGLLKRGNLLLVSHTGGQQGTSTALTLVPEHNAAVVILANMDGVEVSQVANQILSIALDLKE